jgi:BirA family biotin operon repressor/biotin-[acetyl-CoA-carboxylase] ligase
MNLNILRFEEIDSTNSEAARQARLGASEGLCVIAGSQSAGRGRNGRSWVSDAGAGLYFSIVLRPRFDARFYPLITLMAGVAVHAALTEFDLKPDIKWVNDILIDDKKISGILSESIDTPAGTAVIVGIGINLTANSFPGDIANLATSVENESGKRLQPGEMAEVLTRFLSYFYSVLSGENGPAEIIEQWRRRSSYFCGKQVRVDLGDHSLDGVTDGLEENGALRVKTLDGSVTIVHAGDVHRLRAADRAHETTPF